MQRGGVRRTGAWLSGLRGSQLEHRCRHGAGGDRLEWVVSRCAVGEVDLAEFKGRANRSLDHATMLEIGL
jgi:hypothetical protein